MTLLHRKYFQTEELQRIVSHVFFNYLDERSKVWMLQEIKKRCACEIVQVMVDNPYLKDNPEMTLGYYNFNPVYVRMISKVI